MLIFFGSFMKNGLLRKILPLFTLLLVVGGQNSMCDMRPIQFTKDTLENGLQVIYHIDRSAPVVATIVHYRVGSRDEDPNKTGYAHLFEHLMFEATTNIPRASIDKYVQEAGGDLNAHTSFDETVYYLRLPSNEIKLALWIESERMRGLLLEPVGVETQRGVVIEELKMRRNNQPYGTLLDEICDALFPGSSYQWTTLGSEEHLRRASIEDFRNFYNNFYQPNNATLVIAGDIDIEETRKYVQEYFGSLPKASEPKRNDFRIDPMKGEVRKKIDDEKAQLPAIFIGFRAPAIGDADYYPMTILLDILSAGESSRLYQTIVDKERLAAQAGAFPFALEKSGMAAFYAIAAPNKKLDDIEKLIFKEINKIIEKGISDEELTKAKNIKESEFIFSKKDVMEKAQTLARYNSYYNDPSLINDELKKFLSVTKEDVQRVAKLYFGTQNRVVLQYIPKKSS